MADKNKNPIETGELSKMVAALEKANRQRKSIFGSTDKTLRRQDRSLAGSEAGVLLGASRLDALAELSEGGMNRAIKKISSEEANVQKSLATAYNAGNQEIQEAVEDYSRRLSELYWQSTQISVGVGEEGKKLLVNKYIPTVDLLIDAISNDPLFNTERTKKLFQSSLLEYANKIKNLLESRIGIFSRLSSSVKSLVRSDVVAGALAGAASKNALVALAAFAYTRRKRSNTYASRLGVEQQGLGLRKTLLGRGASQKNRLSERASPVSSVTSSVSSNNLKEGSTTSDTPTASSSVAGNSVEKILVKHTALLEKIYGTLSGSLKLQQQQLAAQLAADEESALESQPTTEEFQPTAENIKKSPSLFGSLFSRIGNLFSGIFNMFGGRIVRIVRILGSTLTTLLTKLTSTLTRFLPGLTSFVTSALPFAVPAAILLAEVAGIKALLDLKNKANIIKDEYEDTGLNKKVTPKAIEELKASGIDTTHIEQATSDDTGSETEVKRRATANAFLMNKQITPEEVKTFEQLGGEYEFETDPDGKILPRKFQGRSQDNRNGTLLGFTNKDAELYLRAKQLVLIQKERGGTKFENIFSAAMGAPPDRQPVTPSATPSVTPSATPSVTPSATPLDKRNPDDFPNTREGRAAYIQQQLLAAGYSNEQTQGIMANLRSENAQFDPAQGGDNGNAIGIAQWNGPRKKEVLAHQRSRSGVPALQAQVEFLINELASPPYNLAPHQLSQSSNEAAQEILFKFEKPAPQHRSARSRQYAQMFGGTAGLSVSAQTPEQQGRGMTTQGISYNPPAGTGGGGNVIVSNVNAPQTAVNNGGGNNMMPPVWDPSPTLRVVLA